VKKLLFIILCAFIALSCGCSDRVDIENRGYILGIAIDAYPPIPKGLEGKKEENEEKKMELMPLDTGKPMYTMTVQMPIVAKSSLRVKAGTSGKGGSDEERSWEITLAGNSFFEMNREIAARTNFRPFYEHLQVIIISDEVARKGLANVLDFFIRDPEMRRRTKVYITKGEAKKVLDVRPRIEDYSSIYLAKITDNAVKSARIIYKTDLGELVKSIHLGLDSTLPIVEGTKDEIKEAGIAILKDDKMVGSTTGDHLESIKYISNLHKGGVETAKIPGRENAIATLEVKNVKTKTTPKISGRIPTFKIDIKVRGDYIENINIDTHGKIDEEYLRTMEKVFADSIKKKCMETIKLMQEKFKADVFQFEMILRTEEPSYWKKYKNEWDDIFPEVKTEVNVSVEIQQIGTSR